MKSNDFHHKMNLIGIQCSGGRLMFGCIRQRVVGRGRCGAAFMLHREINYTRNATLKFYASGKLPNRKQFILFICVESYANNVQLVARHPSLAGAPLVYVVRRVSVMARQWFVSSADKWICAITTNVCIFFVSFMLFIKNRLNLQ